MSRTWLWKGMGTRKISLPSVLQGQYSTSYHQLWLCIQKYGISNSKWLHIFHSRATCLWEVLTACFFTVWYAVKLFDPLRKVVSHRTALAMSKALNVWSQWCPSHRWYCEYAEATFRLSAMKSLCMYSSKVMIMVLKVKQWALLKSIRPMNGVDGLTSDQLWPSGRGQSLG